MGRLILVTGGARSGKSIFAENTAKGFGEKILYVATSIPFDEEMKLRVKKHREQRPAHWETLEAYKNLDKELEKSLYGKDGVLLDCITIMVSNIIFDSGIDFDKISRDEILFVEAMVKFEIDKLLKAVKQSDIPFVLVTNEVGMGIVPESPLARLFRDVAGKSNQDIAKEADEVYFCVSGIHVKIK